MNGIFSFHLMFYIKRADMNLTVWHFSTIDLTTIVTSNSSFVFLKLRHSATDQQHERGNKITGLRLIVNFFTQGKF